MADNKIDPISEKYYRPLSRADALGDWLFYSSALLSIVILYVPAQWAQLLFALSVVVLFVVTLTTRLYFFPRAQVCRYQDFLAHALGRGLTHDPTVAYYNNAADPGPTKVAAQVLESSFFSREILSRMLPRERIKLALYIIVWLIAVLYRQTDLAFIGVAAQILFSEQILSRWLRLEWFRWKCEKIYESLFSLFETRGDLTAAAFDQLGQYEIAKATSAISLSSNIFEQNRIHLNSEWEKIRKTLSL